ncbi:MAG TPA: polymer-forming cytoskeletal protein [Methylomirabilota bacterium]|nr:polymer-forming cytoskeletal protein [Methylomirabilota bacterium]
MSETPGEKMKHLDEMTCLLYAERQLDRARALEVSAHAQECEACQTLLRALERESRLLTRAMLEEDEPLPSRLAVFQERARRALHWIWGLAFGLAATGAYALYADYIQPWQRELEQAGFGGSNLLNLLIFQGAFWKGWQSMITVLEAAALMTLGAFAVMFLRRRMRRGGALAVVLAGLCALLAMPAPAAATEFRKADTVDIGKDEKIKGDVYIMAQRARVDGTVDGDVIVFSPNVDINGHVMGDVIAFATSVRINGQVDGNVRGANNNITITGNVARNVTDFCQTFTLDANGKVGGSLTSFSESFSQDGSVGRDMLLFFAHGTFAGKVAGGIRAKGDSLVITSSAVIDGPIRFEGNKQADVSPSAKLASPVEFHRIEKHMTYRSSSYYVWQVIWAAAFILFGLVLFALMPKFSEDAVKSAEHYGASAGLGVLVLFGVPIAAIIACITVVGLFLGIATLFVWYGSLYFAQVIVGAVIGQWLMGRTSELWPLIGRMAVGLILVRLCTTIPHVGGWVKFVAILWGIGAISLAIYRRFQPTIAPVAPAAPYTPPMPPNTTVGGTMPA